MIAIRTINLIDLLGHGCILQSCASISDPSHPPANIHSLYRVYEPVPQSLLHKPQFAQSVYWADSK